jgi:RimJ/RimL family protein N-acetyltransferase
MSDQVSLRPVAEDDLHIVDLLTNDPAASEPYLWFGWHAPEGTRRRWSENGLLGPDNGMLMAVVAAERLGFVSWHKIRTGAQAYSWNVGIALLPGARGKGHGTEAQRLLVRYLFAHTTVNRVEATTEVGNLAEQRSLEKAGFTREGVLRGYDFRDGQWRDNVIYSVVRDDLGQATGRHPR